LISEPFRPLKKKTPQKNHHNSAELAETSKMHNERTKTLPLGRRNKRRDESHEKGSVARPWELAAGDGTGVVGGHKKLEKSWDTSINKKLCRLSAYAYPHLHNTF